MELTAEWPGPNLSAVRICIFAELNDVPSLRCEAERAIGKRDAFAAWGPEVDEPLLEDAPRHLLQDRDPPRVVLNQVVVPGKPSKLFTRSS